MGGSPGQNPMRGDDHHPQHDLVMPFCSYSIHLTNMRLANLANLPGMASTRLLVPLATGAYIPHLILHHDNDGRPHCDFLGARWDQDLCDEPVLLRLPAHRCLIGLYFAVELTSCDGVTNL